MFASFLPSYLRWSQFVRKQAKHKMWTTRRSCTSRACIGWHPASHLGRPLQQRCRPPPARTRRQTGASQRHTAADQCKGVPSCDECCKAGRAYPTYASSRPATVSTKNVMMLNGVDEMRWPVRKLVFKPGYSSSRYPVRTVCTEICAFLSYVAVFPCILFFH